MEKYRTFWPRFWAGFVDGLVFLPVTLFDKYLSSPAREPGVLIAWAIFSYSAFWVYSVLMHARYGQTLGKKALGVKVLDVSEERIPSLRQAFLRDVVYVALSVFSLIFFIYLVAAHKYVDESVLENSLPGRIFGYASLGWFLLEIATMLTNSKRRAFHDFIANTVVVKT